MLEAIAEQKAQRIERTVASLQKQKPTPDELAAAILEYIKRKEAEAKGKPSVQK